MADRDGGAQGRGRGAWHGAIAVVIAIGLSTVLATTARAEPNTPLQRVGELLGTLTQVLSPQPPPPPAPPPPAAPPEPAAAPPPVASAPAAAAPPASVEPAAPQIQPGQPPAAPIEEQAEPPVSTGTTADAPRPRREDAQAPARGSGTATSAAPRAIPRPLLPIATSRGDGALSLPRRLLTADLPLPENVDSAGAVLTIVPASSFLGPRPTGDVTVMVDGRPVAAFAIRPGRLPGSSIIPAPPLITAVGNAVGHTVTLSYSGDATYEPSEARVIGVTIDGLLELVPSLPPLPQLRLPPLPALPPFPHLELPRLPALPNLELPRLPSLPRLQLPRLPSLPRLQLPGLPALPDLELPQLPALPKVPAIPRLPAIPRVPDAPTLPANITLPQLPLALAELPKIEIPPLPALALPPVPDVAAALPDVVPNRAGPAPPPANAAPAPPPAPAAAAAGATPVANPVAVHAAASEEPGPGPAPRQDSATDAVAPSAQRPHADGLLPYDLRSHPERVAALLGSTFTLAQLLRSGLGGASGSPRGRRGRVRRGARGGGDSSGSAYEGTDVEMLAGSVALLARGDRSRTWTWPGTALLDRISASLPARLARPSPLAARIVEDATYLRAMIGSASLLTMAAGGALGVAATLDAGGEALPPTFALTIAIAVLGVLDAAAGMLAVMIFMTGVLALGGVDSNADVRVLLGLSALWFAVPIIAGAARPLRREPDRGLHATWERAADFLIASLIGAWAVQQIVLALPGLAGLDLPIADRADAAAVAVLCALVVRIGAETVSAALYPRRLSTAEAVELAEPGNVQRVIACLVRASLFVFFALTLLRPGWQLWACTAMFVIPQILSVFEDRLPSSPRLSRALPRGLLELVVMLLVVTALGALLVSLFGESDEFVQNSFVVLSVPGFALSIASLFGRDADEPEMTWRRRLGGSAVLGFGVLLALGMVI
jgi:hypothetical protein